MVSSSSPPPLRPTTYKKKKILIVDDDPDITFSLKTALEEYNGDEQKKNRGGLFELVVDTFTDPTDVVSNYNQPGMYDLLIIDIVMPKMNGFELYEKVTGEKFVKHDSKNFNQEIEEKVTAFLFRL